jgi:hypothetical protein
VLLHECVYVPAAKAAKVKDVEKWKKDHEKQVAWWGKFVSTNSRSWENLNPYKPAFDVEVATKDWIKHLYTWSLQVLISLISISIY